MNELLNETEAAEVTERDNLAVVAIVSKLEPIEGKDFVELVHLKDIGYTFVCEKIHKVGDKVVYVKYDSIAPGNELFDFLGSTDMVRIKQKSFTHKDADGTVVGKTYSQGIVLPLARVIEFTSKRDCSHSDMSVDIDALFQSQLWEDGDDLTFLLEIKKYIPKENGSGSSLGNMMKKCDFPSHIISKTDEVNCSSRTRALLELEGKSVYFTLKSEGSSCTAYVDPEDGVFNVCTRNNSLKEVEGSKFWEAVNKYNLKEQIPEKCPNIAIQGELVGPKIQSNHHGLSEPDLHVFTMTDILDNKRRLSYNEMGIVADQLGLTLVKTVYLTNNFKIVENIDGDTWNPKDDTIDENTVWTFDRLQKFADIQVYDNGSLAEGIVIRPCEPFLSQKLRINWSGKIINRDYRL